MALQGLQRPRLCEARGSVAAINNELNDVTILEGITYRLAGCHPFDASIKYPNSLLGIYPFAQGGHHIAGAQFADGNHRLGFHGATDQIISEIDYPYGCGGAGGQGQVCETGGNGGSP